MKRKATQVAAVVLGAMLVAAGFGAAAESAPATLAVIDANFAAPADKWAKVWAPPDAADRITGTLPAGWADDSGWAKVSVDYRQVREDGRAFLRAEVKQVTDGRGQFHHLIPDFGNETYFRLTIVGRSRTASAAEVGIRMGGQPYEFLWVRNVAFGPAWKEHTYDFRLNRNSQPVGLWINQSGVGAIDLASVRLVRMTREGLIAELKARLGDEGSGNLLRNTRMPLGIESGWSIGRDNSDGDDVQVTADAKVVGPSGSPALAIHSAGERTTLYCPPFAVPRAFEKHTASLFIRGHAKGGVGIVGASGGGGGGKTFEVDGDEWKRIEVTFSPELLRPFYALRFEVKGDLWIDALQVERGEKATPYAGQMACEVSLAVESPARVQFDDEPAVVHFAVTGAPPAGAMVKARVVSPYGTSADLPAVAVGAVGGNGDRHVGGEKRADAEPAPVCGELRYDRLPATPYGVFRVEAFVADAAGKAVSPPNELVVYRLRRPRYWMKDAPASHFGTHTNSTTRHILMAKAVGVNWVRLHDAGTEYIGWYHLEPEKGKWAFRDKELKRYRTYGMKVLGAFSTAPRWASYLRDLKLHNGYFDRFYQPLDLADFANYVRTVADRYKDGVIDTWDVWNEPWIHAWWAVAYDESKKDRDGYMTSKNAQADFARLMATAYTTAKAADPAAKVLGVNSTAGGATGAESFSGHDWTTGVIAAGGLDHCDVVCYHQYTGALLGGAGDAAEKGYADAVGPIIDKLGRCPKPVWMTEGSPTPQGLGDGFYHYTLPQGSDEDRFAPADHLARYLVSILSQGVEKVFLYSMHSHNYFGSNEWRVLVTPEGYLHPSAAAHSTAAWLLEDTHFVRREELANGVWAYTFEGAGRTVTAVLPMPNHAPWPPPAAAGDAAGEVVDLFGNPVPPGQAIGQHVIYVLTKGNPVSPPSANAK